jgi:hypothetical protein
MPGGRNAINNAFILLATIERRSEDTKFKMRETRVYMQNITASRLADQTWSKSDLHNWENLRLLHINYWYILLDGHDHQLVVSTTSLQSSPN